MKKRVIFLTMISILTLAIMGCEKNTFTNKIDKEELMKNFEDMIFENEKTNIYQVKKYVEDNINKLDNLDMSSSMVNTYIYSLYNNLNTYAEIVSILQKDFLNLEKEIGVESLSVELITDIPSEYKIIKSILGELKENNFILVKENNSYGVDVDIEKINKKYSNYMNKDTQSYLNFRINERNLNIYDINADEYNIDLLLEITNDIFKNIEKQEGVSQKENWMQTLYYYLSIVTSTTHETFIDAENVMSKEIYDKMEKAQEKYDDSKFGQFLKNYLSVLNTSNFKVDSEEVEEFLEKVDQELEVFLIEKK